MIIVSQYEMGAVHCCMWHNMGMSRVNKKNMAHVINDMGHILENLVGIYGVDIIGDVETILDGVTATTVP